MKIKPKKYIKALKVSNDFENVAKNKAKLSEEDIDLGWNTKSEMPEDAVFKLKLKKFPKPLKSSFGWHIVKSIGHKRKK